MQKIVNIIQFLDFLKYQKKLDYYENSANQIVSIKNNT